MPHSHDVPARLPAPARQPDDALRAGERQLHRIVEMSPDLICILDQDGRYCFVNAAYERVLGYLPHELSGQRPFDFLHPDDAAAVAGRFTELRDQLHPDDGPESQHLPFIVRARRRDGHWMSFEAKWQRLSDAAGRFTGVLVVSRDVTERQRAEQALRRSEERFRLLLEHASDIVVMLDHGGVIRYASPAVERVLGYRPEEVVGRECFTFVHPQDRARVRDDFFSDIARTGPQNAVQFRAQHRDGSLRYLETAATNLLGDPSMDGVLINVRDITDRTRSTEVQRFLAEAGEALASSLDYETTLASVARLAVPRLADWCAVDVVAEDGAIYRLAVAAADPAKEEALHELRRRYPFDPQGQHGVPQVIHTGEPQLVAEVTADQLAAETVDADHLRLVQGLGMRSYLRVPLVARGRTLGAVSLIAAESGRRYGTTDLALALELARRAALAVDNAQLYEAERSARAEAQTALRVREEFLAGISHDLKTPLTTIRGFAQLLARRVARSGIPGTEVVQEALASIDAATVRMTGLVVQLLDLARLQSGQGLDLQRQPTDLVALARQVAAEHQRATERHRIRVQAAEADISGMWDPIRLERVVANLVSNAVKYSPEGGDVTVTLARDGAAAPERVWLTVQDHGLGIPARDLAHIFTRFHRGANVIGRIEGSGIGLAGARQIVEQHGGAVEVTSAEGAGTTVTVCLPLG